MSQHFEIKASVAEVYKKEILTASAMDFLIKLQKNFNQRRLALLALRKQRQAEIDKNGLRFLTETKNIRGGDWHVASSPADLKDRRVEITGPVDKKMIINALNSGARIYMADFEDSHSPTWENCLEGQLNLKRAVRRKIDFTADNGKKYQLNQNIATLVVRPRGWHLQEKHIYIDSQPMSASLFDFGLYFFHNAQEKLDQGSGPYFYLPKLENHTEARLWNDVFLFAQEQLHIPRGSIRATVLIETLPAAFEMEEILYELRDHVSGLNAGRWDYIFSCIKRLYKYSSVILPNRDQVRMTSPFMRAYTKLLVPSCHKHGAHAMGGMSAFIPNRKDEEVTQRALKAVVEDKTREVNDGFDGTWVAHPDLVPVAMTAFDKILGHKPNQIGNVPEDSITAEQLLDLNIQDGTITETGMRHNISVALQYMNAWLGGLGAVALYNLMEDAATAEISRAQLWQWVHQHAKLDDGREITTKLYQELRDEEIQKLQALSLKHLTAAQEILDELVLSPEFIEFLTLPAYEKLLMLE